MTDFNQRLKRRRAGAKLKPAKPRSVRAGPSLKARLPAKLRELRGHLPYALADGMAHLLVPWRRLTRDVSAGGSGGSLVLTELEVSQHLLGSSAASQVGCRVLMGLKGDLAMERWPMELAMAAARF
jgi:hypothetical protein